MYVHFLPTLIIQSSLLYTETSEPQTEASDHVLLSHRHVQLSRSHIQLSYSHVHTRRFFHYVSLLLFASWFSFFRFLGLLPLSPCLHLHDDILNFVSLFELRIQIISFSCFHLRHVINPVKSNVKSNSFRISLAIYSTRFRSMASNAAPKKPSRSIMRSPRSCAGCMPFYTATVMQKVQPPNQHSLAPNSDNIISVGSIQGQCLDFLSFWKARADYVDHATVMTCERADAKCQGLNCAS